MSDNGGNSKVPILFGAVLALAGASMYSFYEINQLKAELAETKELLSQEVGKVNETSTSTTRSTRESVAALKAELEEARAQATQLAGQAKIEAARHADVLAGKLEEAQKEQAEQTAKVAENLTAVSQQVNAVKEDTSVNRDKVAAVSSEVAAVKSQADATKAELQKTISELTSTRGDLGIQSGLIATNARELAALKERGERVYTEFRLAKTKKAERVGDLQIRLTKTDQKKNKYTVEVVVDDKLVEKKDRTANEPVQFLVPRATIPYELVVNEVRKDLIIGYLSAPKVQASRN